MSATLKANQIGEMDLILSKSVSEAALKTFGVQAQTLCQVGAPFSVSLKDKHYPSPIGIVGSINIVSSRYEGTISLAFPKEVFLTIYENMLGEKHSVITPELQDAAAELLNMIYGAVKTQINQISNFDLQPSIPTVFVGENLIIRQRTQEQIVILPCKSTAGDFQLEIALQNK